MSATRDTSKVFLKRNMRGSSSKTRNQPEGTKTRIKRKTKCHERVKESTSPTIDKYFKVHPSSTREEDTLSKEVGDRSTIVGEEKEEPLPSCTKTETDKVDEVDSVELKPKPKQIKNDGTKTQGVPESPQILAKVSAQSKTLQMETKATGRTSNKRRGEGRRKKTVATTRESDGDFIPPSGQRKQPVQQSIRDHFPVRRSTRKPKAIIESEKFEEIADKLLSQDESDLKVVEVDGKGKGVVSTRCFTKGELICEYSGDLISYEEAKAREEEYSKDETVGCYMYYFEHKGTKLCVDATKDNGRMGRLLNHSKTQANVVTKLYEVEEQPYLCLIAARDIKSGEELQYDYGERSKAAIESHPWLAS